MLQIPYVVGQTGLAQQQRQISQDQTVNDNIDFAYVIGVDANNVPNNFTPANIDGNLIRVGATGNPSPQGYQWTASNTPIAHLLGRPPIGWIVVYKNKTCDIYAGTTQQDSSFIYLTCSDPTAEVNLLLF